MEQFLALALQHAGHGYASPTAHYLCYVVGGDLLAHELFAFGRLSELFLSSLDVSFELLQLAISYFGHALVVAFPFGPLSLKLQVFNLLLVLLNLVNQSPLGLPFGSESLFLVFQFGNLLVEIRQFVAVGMGGITPLRWTCSGFQFAFDSFAFNLQLLEPAFQFVKFLRNGVTLHAQFGCRLIHQVDGLVGKEPVADVSLRKLHSRNAGIVLYPHLVVILVAFLDATQDADSVCLVGFFHHHGLEAAFQCFVLLKIFLILVERGGTDGTQFAPGQSRLQNVSCIHSSLATSGTYQRVYLVDEEDDVALTVGHLLDDALQPLLKLTLVFGTGHKSTHVERIELLVFQVFRHVATHNALGQSFGNGRLTRTRFTY